MQGAGVGAKRCRSGLRLPAPGGEPGRNIRAVAEGRSGLGEPLSSPACHSGGPGGQGQHRLPISRPIGTWSPSQPSPSCAVDSSPGLRGGGPDPTGGRPSWAGSGPQPGAPACSPLHLQKPPPIGLQPETSVDSRYISAGLLLPQALRLPHCSKMAQAPQGEIGRWSASARARGGMCTVHLRWAEKKAPTDHGEAEPASLWPGRRPGSLWSRKASGEHRRRATLKTSGAGCGGGHRARKQAIPGWPCTSGAVSTISSGSIPGQRVGR